MSTSFQLQNNALKELPHNIEAEQGILGAILLNNEIFFDISETINVEHFYEPVHKLIFDVIGKMISKGQIATPITLKSFFAKGAAAELPEPPCSIKILIAYLGFL